MNLYATIQSERASKGQGGNRYLDIDIFTTSREKPTHNVHVIYNESGAIGVKFSALHFGAVKILAEDKVYTNVENGKQEKGEYQDCWCDREGLVMPHNKFDHIINRTN